MRPIARGLIVAAVALASATAPASATVLSFRPLATITGWATGRGVVAWQTPERRLVMLRDGEVARLSVALPDGCALVAVARAAALVSCHVPPQPSTPRVYVPGAAGLQDVPGAGPYDGFSLIGARWLAGYDCSREEPHTGCPPVFLDWHTGRRVGAMPGARDLDAPDLRVLPRLRPRYTLRLGDGLSVIAYRTRDRRRLAVHLPPGTVPDTAGTTRDRAFIAAPIPGAKEFRLLEARLPG